MSVLSPRGGKNASFNLTPVQLARMKELWEGSPDIPASRIAEMFSVTKNTVIGHARRRGWKRPFVEGRKGPLPAVAPTTIFTRLDALNVFPPSGCCVYPIGDPGRQGFRFCGGAVAEPNAPYCCEHTRVTNSGDATKRRIAEWEGDELRRLQAAARMRKLGGNKAQRGVA